LARKKNAKVAHDSLVKLLVGASEASERLEALGDALSTMKASEAADLLRSIDSEFLSSPETCVAFLSVLNAPGFAKYLKGLSWENLRSAVDDKDSSLINAWDLVWSFSIGERAFILAKMSLVFEIHWLVSSEMKDSADIALAFGSLVAMQYLTDCDPEDPELVIRSASFDSAAQDKLREVLEEMDFARVKKDQWSYRIDIDTRTRLVSGRNLLAYRTLSRDNISPLAMARMAQNIVQRFSLLSRTISMYPSDHPSIAPSIDSFIGSVSEFYGSDCNMVTLTILGGELMVNNLKIGKKTRAIDDFLRHLSDRRINSLTFEEGLMRDSLLKFITIFNRPPTWIKDKGGMPKLLASRDIQHLSVGEFRYALIAKDGSLVEDSTSASVDTALEDMIFRELIERLERGDSIRGIPDAELGLAFKKILEESSGGAERQRGLLAEFVATLDPTILEKGILSIQDVRKNMAWSALRKIIEKSLEDLQSNDPDVVLHSIEKLHDLSLTGISRNKSHTIYQIIEDIGNVLESEYIHPDALFAGIVLLGSICERLISTGSIAASLSAVQMIEMIRKLEIDSPELMSSRRRGLAEAMRRIDTPEVGDRLIEALLSRNNVTTRNAEELSGILVLRNLTTKLMDMFLEPDRSQRARAFSLLKATGLNVLPVLHARILRLEIQTETPRDPETGRLMDEDWYVIRNIIAILGELKHASSSDVLIIASADVDDRIRATSIRALYSISREKAFPLATKMITDPSNHVLRVCMEVLATCDHPSESILPRLFRLFDRDEESRRTIMRIFQRLASSPQVQRFIRTEFKAAKGVPYGNVSLATDALICFLKSGDTADIAVLRAFHETRSGKGVFKKSGHPKDFMATVLATIESIKKVPFITR